MLAVDANSMMPNLAALSLNLSVDIMSRTPLIWSAQSDALRPHELSMRKMASKLNLGASHCVLAGDSGDGVVGG